MQHVWLAQCLCPQRHAILCGVGEADGEAAAESIVLEPLRAQVAKYLAEAVMNPWCGLCHAKSGTWRYEVGRTKWHTLAEAKPGLEAMEAKNIETGAVFGELLGRKGGSA